jgi:preprotein translocase subunit SecF
VSPLERRNDKLRDLELGQGAGGRPAPDPDPEEPVAGAGPEDLDENELEELYEGLGEGQEVDPAAEALAEELEGELTADEAFRRLARRRRPDPGTGRPGPLAGLGPLRRLYRGETSFDFVGRRRWWFTFSALVIVAGLVSLGVRGLNLGIDFKGGTAWTVTTSTVTQSQAERAVSAAGLPQPTVEVLRSRINPRQGQVEVQADLNDLPPAKQQQVTAAVTAALERLIHSSNPNSVSVDHVGPTWGGQVTQRALIALIVFFVVVAVYISFRFEPKMALAAFVAMVHDLLVTMGVYSLAGFQVTPDTVIAVLTILGYSLYDTVVVFDRVRDNARGFGASGRMTYSEMVDLSMNQTLARSINTSLVAILPVLAVLLIGVEIFGAITLQDYGLALVIGLFSGAYSSIFIASPVLAVLKEREPRYVSVRQRLEQRSDRLGLLTPAAAASLAGGAGGGPAKAARTPRPGAGGALRPGQAARGSGRRPVLTASAPRAGTGTGNRPVEANGGNGPGTGAPAAASPAVPAAAGAPGAGTGRPMTARRPPARPRKGGKAKGKKRR